MPCLLFCAVSCNKGTAPQQCGISMKRENPENYGETTVSYVQDTVRNLLTAITDSFGDLATVIHKQKEELTSDICAVFLNVGAPERDLLAFFRSVEERNDALIELISDAFHKTGDADTLSIISALLADVSDAFGKDAVPPVLKGLVLCEYNYAIRKNRARAADYASTPSVAAMYTSLAQKGERERAVFDAIDARIFAQLTNYAVVLFGLFRDADTLPSLMPATFSDAELSALAARLDTDVHFSTEEWNALFGLFETFGGAGLLLKTVRQESSIEGKTADTAAVGEFLNDLFSLLTKIRGDLTPERIHAVRSADEADFAAELYRSLSDETRAEFDRLFTLRLTHKLYRNVIQNDADLSAFFDVEVAHPSDLATCQTEDLPALMRGLLKGIFYD